MEEALKRCEKRYEERVALLRTVNQEGMLARLLPVVVEELEREREAEARRLRQELAKLRSQ